MGIKEISMLLEKLYSKPHTETFIKEVEYPAKECLKETWEDGAILETYFYDNGITRTFLMGNTYLLQCLNKEEF